MKHMKKLASFLLAMVMVLSLTVTAFAAGTNYTITVPADDTHTYSVYQIFTGDLNNGVLSNVKWGQNAKLPSGKSIGDSVDQTVLDALTAQTSSTSDSDKLDVINQYVDLTSTAFGTASKDQALNNVPAGYYLLKDNGTLTGDDSYTTYIVQVVEDITVSRKASKPGFDKEVQDEAADKDKNSTDTTNGWGETADHAINETFKFKLTATLPNDTDLDAYDSYKLVFHDTLNTGITFDGNVEVTVNGNKVTTGYTVSENAVAGTKGSLTWSLTIDNLKTMITGGDIKNATVVVTYDAHLNEDAAVGNVATNKNTASLEYSNNPNWDGTGTEDTGKTEEDVVYVFTYGVDNEKFTKDAQGNEVALEGAGFTLYDSNNQVVKLIFDQSKGAYRPATAEEAKDTAAKWEMTSTKLAGSDKATFNIIGLDCGTYTLKETTTPAGYNTCADITVTISAAHNETTTGATTTFTKNAQTGTLNKIENKTGSTLPETGGIGTTMFYIIGGLLVVGAAILLIVKRRMRVQ